MCSRYRDFKKSLKQVRDGKTTDAVHQAVDSLISVSVKLLCDCFNHYPHSIFTVA